MIYVKFNSSGAVCWLIIAALALLAIAAFIGSANAECPMCAPDYETYPHEGFLKSLGPEEEKETGTVISAKSVRAADPKFQSMFGGNNGTNASDGTVESESQPETAAAAPERSAEVGGFLVASRDVARSDLVLDVSKGATSYIDGAAHIDYVNCFDDSGMLKSATDLAAILGQAGVSADDRVITTGTDNDCPTCKTGPFGATFAYWMMMYLGHDRAKLAILDGGTEAWQAAGLAVRPEPSARPATTYSTGSGRPELFATYDYVMSGEAQIVDARLFTDFGKGNIPNSVPIPYEKLLENGRFKSESQIAQALSQISKDKPVVVYAKTAYKASLVWFAMEMMGYDARLYSWNDYLANQPALQIRLNGTMTRAEPNPASPGPVVIYTAFELPGESGSGELAQEASASIASDENNTTLTTMGCATCEPISIYTSTLSNNNGSGIQLGSSASNQVNFTCQAVVKDALGNEVRIVPMSRIEADRDEFVGTWDASSAEPGDYPVGFIAGAYGLTADFKSDLVVRIQ